MKRDNLHGWFDELNAALDEIDGIKPVVIAALCVIGIMILLIGVVIFSG